MIEKILALGIGFGVETVFLALGLWIMIKIQKLDYGFFGLIGSAALGAGLDMIPYVGHALAVVSLYLCLRAVTRADLFPDVVFTVAVAYALVFCMNLFVLASLMGDLRSVARARFNPHGPAVAVADADMDEDTDADADADADAPTPAAAKSVVVAAKTSKPAAAPAKNSKTDSKAASSKPAAPAVASEDKPGFVKSCVNTVMGWFGRKPAATPPAADKALADASAKGSGKDGSTNAPTAPVKVVDPAIAKRANEVATTFALKGVTQGFSDSSAIVFSGVKNYTIGVGESLSMETVKGNKITVRCASVEERKIVLDVEGIQVALLHR